VQSDFLLVSCDDRKPDKAKRTQHWAKTTRLTTLGFVFIEHSENKSDGTANSREHHASPFVVGAGNATREEIFDD